MKQISHDWKGSASKIREYKTSFLARVDEDPENPSEMVLREPRKSDGRFGHNIIDEESENEPHSTKRLDDRVILTRFVLNKCLLQKP